MKKSIPFIFLIYFVFAAEAEQSGVSFGSVTQETERTLRPIYEPVDVSFIHSDGLENILSILEDRFFKLQKIEEYRSENPARYVMNPATHIPELVPDITLENLEAEFRDAQEKYIRIAEGFIIKIRSLRMSEIQKLGKILGDLRKKAKEKKLLEAFFLEKLKPREYDYLHGARECPLACMILKAFDQIALLRREYCGLNISSEDVADVLPVLDLFGRATPEFIEMLSITIDAKITPFENILTILQHPHVGSDINIVNEAAIPNLDGIIKKYQETEAVDLHTGPYVPVDIMLPLLNITDFLEQERP